MIDIQAVQKALIEAGLDGWLFYDFHHRDLMAYKILGLDQANMTSRRWFSSSRWSSGERASLRSNHQRARPRSSRS